jgi:hypothetical protein
MTDRPQKITLAEMRSSGVRGVLVYCADYRCSHHVAISGDRWPDDVRRLNIRSKKLPATPISSTYSFTADRAQRPSIIFRTQASRFKYKG